MFLVQLCHNIVSDLKHRRRFRENFASVGAYFKQPFFTDHFHPPIIGTGSLALLKPPPSLRLSIPSTDFKLFFLNIFNVLHELQKPPC